MVDYILKAVEYIWKLIPSVIPPLEVDVKALYYRSVDDYHDEVVVISPYPDSYYAYLQCVNRKDSQVFIKTVLLVINGEKKYQVANDVSKIRIEAHQPVKVPAYFRASVEDNPPRKGTYRLEVVPTFGRSKIVKGSFPVESGN